MYHYVAKESNINILWRKLETIYKQPIAQNKAYLMKRLVKLKYKEAQYN